MRLFGVLFSAEYILSDGWFNDEVFGEWRGPGSGTVMDYFFSLDMIFRYDIYDGSILSSLVNPGLFKFRVIMPVLP